MLKWEDLDTREREMMSIKYGVSCVGEMELVNQDELKKIPEVAFIAMEEKRALRKEYDEAKTKILDIKEPKEIKAKPMKKYIKVKKVKEVKKVKKSKKK